MDADVTPTTGMPFRWLVSYHLATRSGGTGFGNNWMETKTSPPTYEDVLAFTQDTIEKLRKHRDLDAENVVVIAVSPLGK